MVKISAGILSHAILSEKCGIQVLGAFVLYRLQSLRSDIENDSFAIVNTCNTHKGGQHDALRGDLVIVWHQEGQYRRIVELPTQMGYDIHQLQNAPTQISLAMIWRVRLLENLDQRDALLKKFKISLWLTAGTIYSSIFALVTAELIASWGIWCVVVLIVGLLLFGACLCSYIVLIQKAIE
jgi:hypothetical protein